MTPQTVKFRLLQVVLSHLADERVTVGLLHWDGSQLRTAFNASRVPEGLETAPELRRFVRAMGSKFDGMDTPSLPFAFNDITGIRFGEAGLTSWGITRVCQTRRPQEHFDQLASELGLLSQKKAKRSSMRSGLRALGIELVEKLGTSEFISVDVPVQGLIDYESPVSWKNHVWHHTFPIDLTTGTDSLETRFRKEFGRVDAAVPSGEVGVLVAMCDPGDERILQLSKIEAHISECLAGRIEALRVPKQLGKPDYSQLELRVTKDVATATH